jgi:hypothetical protein
MLNTQTQVLLRVVVLEAVLVLAPEEGVGMPGPCAADWDEDEQLTVTGTVVTPEVVAPCPRGGRELSYAYIAATGDDGQSKHWYVMLGAAFDPKQPLELHEGETLTVTGAPVDDGVLVAAALERGGQVVRLRHPYGRPAWRGGCWAADGNPPCTVGQGGPRSW